MSPLFLLQVILAGLVSASCDQVITGVSPSRELKTGDKKATTSGVSNLEVASELPTITSQDVLRFKIKGTAPRFIYKLGSAASTKCDDTAGYGYEQGVGGYSDIDLTAYGRTSLKLCLKAKFADGSLDAVALEKTFDYVLPAVAISMKTPTAASIKVGEMFAVSLTAIDESGAVARSFNEKVEFNIQGYGEGASVLTFKEGLATQTVQATKAGLLIFRLGQFGGLSTVSASSTSFTVLDAPATSIAISGQKRTWAGACAGPLRVYLLDSYASRTTASTLRTVSLSAGAGTIYSDAGCTTSAASTTIASGSNYGDFYFLATNPQYATVTATLGSMSATQKIITVHSPFVSLSSAVASTTANYSIRFNIQRSIPKDGKILVEFPAGFGISGATLASANGYDSTATASISGQVITITRSGLGNATNAVQAIELTINGVTNHATPGDIYQLKVKTVDAASTTIDGDMPSVPFNIVAAGSAKFGQLSLVLRDYNYIVPWNPKVSATTSYGIRFYSTVAIPSAGSLEITFPAEVNISGAALSKFRIFNAATDMDGTTTASVSGQKLTIQRSGGTQVAANNHVYALLNNIVNPSSVSSAYVATLVLKDNSGAVTLGPTNVRFTIAPSDAFVPADTAWPMSNGDYGGTNRAAAAVFPDYPTPAWFNVGTRVSNSVSGVATSGILGPGNVIAGKSSSGATFRLMDTMGKVLWSQSNKRALTGGCEPSAFSTSGSMYLKCLLVDGVTVDAIYIVSKYGDVELANHYTYSTRNDVGFTIDPFGNMLLNNSANPGLMLSYDGLVRWETFNINNWAWEGKTVTTPEGYLLVSGKDVGLTLAYNPDGSERWRFSLANTAQSFGAPLYELGYVYLQYGQAQGGAPSDPRVVKIDMSSGATIWSVSTAYWWMYGHDRFTTSKGFFFYDYNGSKNLVMYDKATGAEVMTVADARTSLAAVNAGPMVDKNENILMNSGDGLVFRSSTDLSLKWLIQNANGSKVPSATNGFFVNIVSSYPSTEIGSAYYTNWTLRASSDSRAYRPGESVTIYAASSMQAVDPITGIANQIDIVSPNGTRFPMAPIGISKEGGATWAGTMTIEKDAVEGLMTVTIEAGQVNVRTPNVLRFTAAPTGSLNTGLKASVKISVIK